MVKIQLLPDMCDAHGQCNAVEPELFPLDDEGYSAIGDGVSVPSELETNARSGVAACPVMALVADEAQA